MKTTPKAERKPFKVKRVEAIKARLNDPVIHEFRIFRDRLDSSPERPLPTTVTLVFVSAASPDQNQLFIDRIPLPSEFWTYHAANRVIRWRGLFGGGTLWLKNDSRDAFGHIGSTVTPTAVTASAQSRYACDVAIDCGVTYQGSEAASGLAWDTESEEWKNAKWVKERLIFQYTTVPEDTSTKLHCYFLDKAYPNIVTAPNGEPGLYWDASAHTQSSYMDLAVDENNPGNWIYTLHFEGQPEIFLPPAPGGGDDYPEGEPKSVFPLFMDAEEPLSALEITGAMNTIFPNDDPGELTGFYGKYIIETLAGYYQAEENCAPFGIFAGKLEVDGQAVPYSYVLHNTLHWSGLSEAAQKATGLPASGSIKFNKNGEESVNHKINRCDPLAVWQLLAEHRGSYPSLSKRSVGFGSQMRSNDLSVLDLGSMSPYVINSENGQWTDKVQERVRNDFADIAMTYIPDELWDSLFAYTSPPYEKPTLEARVAEIAHTEVPGIGSPVPFYESLSTAFLTYGMADGDNENCQYMNGPRAGAWLREEVANSEVYHYHCQLLFAYRWPSEDINTNDRTPLYLEDQKNPSPEQLADIDEWEAAAIADIENNVIENENSMENLKETLIAEVQDAAKTAREQKLYWAFAFYCNNTTVAALNALENIIFASGSHGDTTELSRFFQDNTATLTALDPSGYFARMYNATVSTFLSESILNAMYDFDGDLVDFDLIWTYLNRFVEDNLNNEDPEIAELAQQIDTILKAQDAEEILDWSIRSMMEMAQMIKTYRSLNYMGMYWPTLFSMQYPQFASFAGKFGGMLATGLAVSTTFGLIMGYKSWDELTSAQRGELVTATLDRGLQIAGALAKKGVYMSEIFTSKGLSTKQRLGGAARQLFGLDKDRYAKGLSNISNGMARWLADSAGSLSTGQAISSLFGIGDDDMRFKSKTKKIFGRNMDEFVSCRVGPVLMLTGMGFTIAHIASGESGAALAADVVSLIGASLELFALVGGWMLEAELIAMEGLAAGMIAVAGPLAVVCAAVGFALMLYMRFRKQPDPIEDFVNTDVAEAGFKVDYQCSSMDYATPYVVGQGTDAKSYTGFSLKSGGQYLTIDENGVISLGTLTHLPDTVWVQATDGEGISQIGAISEYEGVDYTTGRYLTLLEDNSIAFMASPELEGEGETVSDGPAIRTQFWYVVVSGPATTVESSEGTSLQSMTMTLAPVIPDANGEYHKENTDGHLMVSGNGVVWTSGSGTEMQLTMETLAPNYLRFADINFLEGIEPISTLIYGPSFGLTPSAPFSISISPDLPDFLYLDTETHTIRTHEDSVATGDPETTYTATAQNWLGTDQTTFKVIIRVPSIGSGVYG